MNMNTAGGHAGSDSSNGYNCYADLYYRQTMSTQHDNTSPYTLPDVQPQQHQSQFCVGHPQLASLDTSSIWPSGAKSPSFPSNQNTQISPTVATPIATRPIGGRNTLKPQPRVKISNKLKREIYKILAVDELSELSEADIEEKLISWINQRPSVVSAEQIREKIRQICEDNPEISKQLAKRVLSLNWMKAFKRKHLSPFMSTPMSTASPVSCPAISDGGSVSIQNRLEPLKRLDFDDFERKQTQAPHHTANQRCGPKGLSSGFYQVPPADSPGPQLPPTSSFVVSPEPPQSWTNYHNVLQSSDSFSYAVDSGGSEHSRPTKENAQRAVETLLNYIDNGAGDVGDFLAVLNLTERLGLHKNGDFTM
ncbi:hypothetical protein M0657_012071 [Pyricularia oryzae]|nr:hypothetical protein M0657_012071 [Pyricularia oryzae]